MAIDIKFYKVPRAIAQRAGVLDIRYRTKDGMFLLDNKDLLRVRMTSEEIETGLQGIVKITSAEAKRLQVENGFRMGDDGIEFNTNPEPVESVIPAITENTEGIDEPVVEESEAEETITEEADEPDIVGSEEGDKEQEEPLAENTESGDEPSEDEEKKNVNNENENTEE